VSLQERRLGAPAFEAINLAMLFEWGKGWTLSATARRDGCDGWEHEKYELMSSPELGDVVGAVLDGMLGL
jgi:hypothetical protein